MIGYSKKDLLEKYKGILSQEIYRISRRADSSYKEGRLKGFKFCYKTMKENWGDTDTAEELIKIKCKEAKSYSDEAFVEGFIKSCMVSVRLSYHFQDEYCFEEIKLPSNKQKALIKKIEENSGSMFEGVTQEEASLFIEKNIKYAYKRN